MKYKFLPHTADLKILAEGKDLEEAFNNSALAMREAMTKNKKIKIKPSEKKNIRVDGKDYESLLYNFLEEFLYLLDAESFIFSEIKNLKIEEKLAGFTLSCDAFGDKSTNYKFSNDVKAITYNDMIVGENSKGKMICQFVLDV